MAGGDGARRWLVVAAIIPAVLGPIVLPIVVPPFDRLDPLPRQGALDYSRASRSSFGALRDEFVALTLGLPFPPSPAAEPRTFAPGMLPGPLPDLLPRVVPESVPPLSNDGFAQGASISGVPYEATSRTKGAHRENGEPAGCGAFNRGSVWFRYTAGRDIGLIANTFGSNYATVLAVYEGVQLGHLTNVGCDSDSSGNALVAFPARRGTTYHFQVAGAVLNGGNLRFHLEPQGVTERVSVSSGGAEANEQSSFPTVSDDGRYVAYVSRATNLAGQDRYACSNSILQRACNQIYVSDRTRGVTIPASVSSAGEWADGPSQNPVLSSTGRYVAFYSSASNLVPDDHNICLPPRPQSDTDRLPSCEDVFLRDLVTGVTERISVDPAGNKATGWSGYPSVSADGRYVAFESEAPNLVEGDGNVCAFIRPVMLLPDMNHRYSAGPCVDVFVRDRLTGTTERISVSSDEQQGNGPSWGASISPDGRYVAFSSSASDLVQGDDIRCPNPNPDTFGSSTGNCTDVFIRDRLTGTTRLVSVASSGEHGDGNSFISPSSSGHAVSAGGRYVLFFSLAHNLTPGSGEALKSQAFVHDMRTRETILVSASSNGEKANDIVSWNTTMSRDGRYVVFASQATNLVPGDTNTAFDVFLRDVLRGTTVLVSVSSTGEHGDNESDEPAISSDGRIVAFHSHATNLVAGDSNFCADDPVGLQPVNCPDIFVHFLPVP